MRPQRLVAACVSVVSWHFLAVGSLPVLAQSNIVSNGSFEERDIAWILSGSGGWEIGRFSAQGTNHVYLTSGTLSQDLTTRPGEEYVVKLAQRSGQPRVRWGDAVSEVFTNTGVTNIVWRYVYTHVLAVSDRTRLSLENADGGATRFYLDDVQVGWLREPITILSQPESKSAVEGSMVTFTVAVSAGPPVFYQWRFNGEPIVGANSPTLALTEVRASHAGEYSVFLSNSVSTLLSATASLEVATPPRSPLIILQPASQSVPAGYGCSLSVVAMGTQPLTYLWRRNGAPLADATNSTLVFAAVQPTDADTYTVVVSNHLGTTWSLPAVLSVASVTGGGFVGVNNFAVAAPVYDVDGITRLSGSNFLAQVYAGATPTVLRPVSVPTAFRTGPIAGFFSAIRPVIPDVAPYATAYVQMRAWQSAQGGSYEEARARGGRFGCSEVIATITQGEVPTTDFVPLKSFSLRSGMPFFTTGRLSSGGTLPDGTPVWLLTGAPGFRYLVEKRIPPQDWVPLLVLTNVTGTVTFTDPEPRHQSLMFYRSRMLD